MSITLKNIDKAKGRDAACGVPIQWTYYNPSLASAVTEQVVALVTTPSSATLSLTIAANPEMPRNLSVVTGSFSSNTCVAVISGTDFWGNNISETLTISSSTTTTTTKIFRTVSRIDTTWTGTLTGRTIKVGPGPRIGLPAKIASSSDILSLKVGAIEGGSGAVEAPMATDTYTAHIDHAAGIYAITPNTAFNGAKDFVVEILSTYGLTSW